MLGSSSQGLNLNISKFLEPTLPWLMNHDLLVHDFWSNSGSSWALLKKITFIEITSIIFAIHWSIADLVQIMRILSRKHAPFIHSLMVCEIRKLPYHMDHMSLFDFKIHSSIEDWLLNAVKISSKIEKWKLDAVLLIQNLLVKNLFCKSLIFTHSFKSNYFQPRKNRWW